MIPRVARRATNRARLLTAVLASFLGLLAVVPTPVATASAPVPAAPISVDAAQTSATTTVPGAAVAPAAADTRPNVVMFMVDDLPPLDGRVMYNYLPNIKSIFVDHGVQFSNFAAETPLCCPARAGFLSGQHTWHDGVVRNDASLFNPAMTIATQLQGVGYQTMLVGKYLNGYSKLAPTVPPGWDKWNAKDGDDYYNYSFYNNGNAKPEYHGYKPKDYLTDVVQTKIDADMASTDPSKPLFAWFAVNAPHKPWTVDPRLASDPACNNIPSWYPPNYAELNVSDKPPYVQASPRFDPHQLRDVNGFDLKPVCRSMLAVDQLIGHLKTELAAQGRLQNTIWIFSGDNGMNFGAHRLDSKLGPYETGIPFFISWPAKLGTTKRTITDNVMNIDFAPTICELAGCTMGPYPNGQAAPDGQSFASLLLGTATSMNRDSIVEDLPASQQGVPGWYAVRTTPESALNAVGCQQAAVLGCRWHYIRYLNGFEELYDDSGGPCYAWARKQVGDPCELQNLAKNPEYLPILNAMRYRLAVLAGNPMGSL